MKIREIGIKDVHCAEPSANLAEVASMMKRHNIGAIPICHEGRLLGVLTDRDLVIGCVAADMQPKSCQARQFMTSNPVTVSPDTELEEAAKIMGREQLRRLPVVDDGKLVGIISLGDVSMAIQDESLLAETLRIISTPSDSMVCH